MHDLEEAFGAPVLEAYGMTEAAHQMASNPLPPARAQAGLGRPRHRSADQHHGRRGHASADRRAGRGRASRARTSSRGYENNPEANAKSFTDGWFRTGDQGFLDAEGYLTLVGRIKELINRGGEKISPREIDEVLLDASRRSPKRCASACRTRRGARKWRRRWSLKERGQRSGSACLLQGTARRVQAAEADSHHRHDSPHRDRQDSARRRRPGVRQARAMSLREDRHRRRGRDRRLHRRARSRGPGVEVVLFARGPHLRAMQERGLRVISPDGDFEVRPTVTGELSTIGRADVVFLGVKAHGLTALAPAARARSSGLTPPSSARRTASPGGTSRASAAIWRDFASSGSTLAVSLPTPSSRDASSARWPILRRT